MLRTTNWSSIFCFLSTAFRLPSIVPTKQKQLNKAEFIVRFAGARGQYQQSRRLAGICAEPNAIWTTVGSFQPTRGRVQLYPRANIALSLWRCSAVPAASCTRSAWPDSISSEFSVGLPIAIPWKFLASSPSFARADLHDDELVSVGVAWPSVDSAYGGF